MSSESISRTLRQEILFARRRIYEIGEATPLQQIDLADQTLFVKREDLSPINAYKWRGAYNRMAQLSDDELSKGVVTASAGNHAQGVALAAKHLGTTATIFMPLATPRMKQVAVKRHGGDSVEIKLVGDTYDAASAAAKACSEDEGRTYIHAYDDLAVMAGQGTLADEIVMSGQGSFDVAFLQVGGGGMAAATATWLKLHYPNIYIIGVEGTEQASMAAAIDAGHPVALDKVDIFCDGTAVRKVGELTHPVCAEMVDEWMTVTNDEVSAGIQFLWEQVRAIPEPSGAMGVAAFLKRKDEIKGKRILSVLCGANMDFEQLATIARRAAVGAARRRFLRIGIPEQAGAMYGLLEALPDTVNIVDFQYGKTDASDATPVIGFDVDPMQYAVLTQSLQQGGYTFSEVTADTDVAFRLIHYDAKLLKRPYFITLEFHERPGALAEFLRAVSPHSNLCYFNYVYSGERVGRALLGFEFDSQAAHQNFPAVLDSAHHAYRAYETIDQEVLKRIVK
ncbi:threonine ammonia-lyase, biosynthetic [Coraliomargarita akajimensis]|uniref:L-threonine dehydratase n=1 Tax=Coraliomargarita akajimensis (strain DSM 45221 / IAM 15411 / JCM 23193 / KCTC 12865 / 04OKA010-24) TaxID=583355 RepID=D5EQF7_CORAD|nr:threonine ammonia-lyase, biosynthetic [Coraliomargarita akajimensis]ADE55771.1 Pyridoxal-5'-phosphate-dependent protein beta subunit [Coraliomargarita akajimensis DSM 45221]